MSIKSSTIYFVGLDVHKESVTAAVFRGRDAEPMHVDRLNNDDRSLRRYFERLAKMGEVRACYEASGAGYVLQRSLVEWGYACELAAPSLIPRRPGDHRKTDRRDAIKIARDFRDDRLTLIHIPSETDERVRDIVRCRETFQREIVKSRHYILKFLRRRGFIYREGKHWTMRHLNWIRCLLEPGTLADDDRMVLTEYLTLCCFRGIRTQSAMVLATELGDLGRFESPRQLMAYVGLVPREDSSGERRRLGAITKAGNARVRHVLVQAAWNYRRRPSVGKALRLRQDGQPPDVIAHAWKCQHRLYRVFHRLAERKPRQVAATAVARELIGFVWAVLHDLDVTELQHAEVSHAA
jgi:transposase